MDINYTTSVAAKQSCAKVWKSTVPTVAVTDCGAYTTMATSFKWWSVHKQWLVYIMVIQVSNTLDFYRMCSGMHPSCNSMYSITVPLQYTSFHQGTNPMHNRNSWFNYCVYAYLLCILCLTSSYMPWLWQQPYMHSSLYLCVSWWLDWRGLFRRYSKYVQVPTVVMWAMYIHFKQRG